MLAPPRNGSLKIATGRYRSARPSSEARGAAVICGRGCHVQRVKLWQVVKGEEVVGPANRQVG